MAKKTNEDEFRELLNDAADKIAKAVELLPLNKTVCECCKREQFANWAAKKDGDQLAPMVTKLRGLASPQRNIAL